MNANAAKPHTMPSGMHEVSKAEFYATVGQWDVHPNAERRQTYWKHRGGRIAGWVSQGYCGPFEYENIPITYAMY